MAISFCFLELAIMGEPWLRLRHGGTVVRSLRAPRVPEELPQEYEACASRPASGHHDSTGSQTVSDAHAAIYSLYLLVILGCDYNFLFSACFNL